MNLVIVTLISLTIIFLSSVLGSSFVLFIKNSLSHKKMNIIIGLASGIMLSISFFGLLIPSIESGKELFDKLSVVFIVIGLLFGALMMYLLDKIIPHYHNLSNEEEGIKSDKLKKKIKLFLAIIIHKIPEGIAVGLSCGIAFKTNISLSIIATIAVSLGIALQNIPEGLLISLSMLDEGLNKRKSFLFGIASGVVEPLFALFAFFVVSSINGIFPMILSFSAGTMMYVTIDELLLELKKGKDVHYGIWSFMIGFALIMVLEIII